MTPTRDTMTAVIHKAIWSLISPEMMGEFWVGSLHDHDKLKAYLRSHHGILSSVDGEDDVAIATHVEDLPEETKVELINEAVDLYRLSPSISK